MSGIFGVYSVDGKSVADELFLGTVALQHRGEEGCGISLPGDGKFYTDKDRQLAYYFFRDRINGLKGLREMRPSAAIGHTLYENTGGLQPVDTWGETHTMSLAMDGVLLGFGGRNDSVMRTLLSRYIDETGNFYAAAERIMERLHGRGSYCVAALVKNGDGVSLVAFRDPRGIKPYCLGQGKDGKFVVASETKALGGAEADFLKDIEPGEVVVVDKTGMKSKTLTDERHAHCAFEWVYFADPTSTIEGRNVYMVRKDLGRMLARRYADRIDVDLVMASPDSGRGVAIGFQQGLSEIRGYTVPYEEAAIKNPGARRTFQVEDGGERMLAAQVKFFINSDVVRGKRVAVGDDSIVRGTVFRDGMIRKLRAAGAERIYPIISCPPLTHACIKDPKSHEFAAHGLTGDMEYIGTQVAGKIDADFVCYPTHEDLVEAIGLDDLCMACMDGRFPVNEELWR